MARPDLEQSFERSLERCLQEIARTGDIEACLRRHAQHADQLRPLLEIAQLTRQHYESVPEPPNGLASGRERFLAAAAQQRARTATQSKAGIQTTGGQRRRFAFAMRFVSVLSAIIVGTTALGGGVVWAANDSLPGELLYPVKIVTEDARLSFASIPQDQVGLTLEFIEDRVGEIQSLVESERPVSDTAIARMEQHVEQALVYASLVSSDEEMVDTLGQIATRTHTQAQVLEQMQFTASQQTQTMLMQAAAVCRQGAEVAENGLGDPQTFRSRYRHQQGTPELTNEPGMMTSTPGNGQEQRQGCGRPGGECTPTPSAPSQEPQATQTRSTSEPQPTPQGPRSTSEPQPTPQGPRSTSDPDSTPQGPQHTSEPQPTPQGPQHTSEPQPTPRKPQTPPQKPQATVYPQMTPSGAQTTPHPQTTTSPGPQATPKSQSTPRGL